MKLIVLGLLTAVAVAATAFKKDYTGFELYEVLPVTKEQHEVVHELEANYDFWSPSTVLVPPQKRDHFLRTLGKNGIQYNIVTENAQKMLDEFEVMQLKAQARSGFRLTWDAYYQWEAINDFIDEVVASSNGMATATDIGQSYEGRTMRLINIKPSQSTKKIWMDCEVGSSNDKCSEIYAGTEAFSEIESKNLGDALANLNSDGSVLIYITVHSYSQVVVSPWSWTAERPDDFDELERVGLRTIEAISDVYGTYYEFSQSTQYFGPTSGSSDDWAKAGAGVALSYTWELRPRSSNPGFLLPPEQIIPTCTETWAGVKEAVMAADGQ
ncbi:unnamed protein product [Cyprideis torosa]|uniref:Peptidase M14 domain-containing protein n=1 Tax=Cyprideis torosa TaxID=163714 RepID=A0A7R8W5B3_9CRUS|nr:unnamed protein product [Cyprideis torosa]CAG0881523.1 unnamed protein product [Cyprideis torosa]